MLFRSVSVNEELDRLLPVLHGLRAAPVPLSVDTVKPAVMRVSIQEGASFINDINALRADGAIEVVAASTAGICFMHMKGHPGNMQESPTYADVVAEVAQFLSARVEAALASGIDRDRISVDPGFGFGKTAAHNMQILRELGKIGAIGQPVVFGASRKSTLGAVTGREVTRREPASIAAAVLAIERGASMVRVHDVAATRDAIAVWQAMRGKTMNPTNDIVREVL